MARAASERLAQSSGEARQTGRHEVRFSKLNPICRRAHIYTHTHTLTARSTAHLPVAAAAFSPDSAAEAEASACRYIYARTMCRKVDLASGRSSLYTPSAHLV